MISSCDHCGRILPLWRIHCPNCKKSAMNWLQLLAIAVIALPALFLLAKFL
jgi:RNA polymerase subunit RPABC4/transcription elongation factor Spt4